MTDLDELERLAKAATKGPWRTHMLFSQGERPDVAICGDGTTVVAADGFPWHRAPWRDYAAVTNDAAYIAAANPAVILELVAELRRLRGDLRCGFCGATSKPLA